MGDSAATERGCALVSGGGRGIGAAIARGLAADGWAVGVNYRSDTAAADSVVREIVAGGGRACALQADVSDPGVAGALLAETSHRLGAPVLVLVNNAGVTRDKLVPQLDDESWDTVLQTNLSGAFRLTRWALRGMVRARYGRVVNIASVVDRVNSPGQAAYAASKAGLIAFTRVAAVEVARLPITVNAVAPGVIDTDATVGTADGYRSAVPAQRSGTAEEVAACVRFLASERASYVTGSVLTVDGGLSA